MDSSAPRQSAVPAHVKATRGTGVADDDLDKREVQVIRRAAEELGVTFEELLAHVATLD